MVDSGSDYDVNEAKEKGIAFVPLSITFDNDTYKDGIEISRSEFYKRMREEDIFPKTAQPSPQDFIDIFEKIKADNRCYAFRWNKWNVSECQYCKRYG